MTISISRKQVTDLARNIDIPGKSYNQKLDIVAASFGFPNQAAMMAVLNRKSVAAPETDLLSGTIADWMAGEDLLDDESPIKNPVNFVVRQVNAASLDVHLGGSQDDYTVAGGSSIRIERRGDLTRFMLYDARCDNPRVFAVPDDGSLFEVPNDFQIQERVEKALSASEPMVSEVDANEKIENVLRRKGTGSFSIPVVDQHSVNTNSEFRDEKIIEWWHGSGGPMAIDTIPYYTVSEKDDLLHGTFDVKYRRLDRRKINALPWQDIEKAPRDGSHFYARNFWPDAEMGQIRAVRFDAPDDRLPVSNDTHSWSMPPMQWLPLDCPEAKVLLSIVRFDPKPKIPTS